jgi:hypothetical protein
MFIYTFNPIYHIIYLTRTHAVFIHSQFLMFLLITQILIITKPKSHLLAIMTTFGRVLYEKIQSR